MGVAQSYEALPTKFALDRQALDVGRVKVPSNAGPEHSTSAATCGAVEVR